MSKRIRTVLARFSREGRRLGRDSRGQGMTEYIIIVALIAIATIGFVTVFGDNVRGLFSLSADALRGEKVDVKTYTRDAIGSKDKAHRDLNNIGDTPP